MAEPEAGSTTSASLLLKLRDAADDAAWRTFVSVYGPLVRRYCIRRGLQHSDAADVSQDVLARVARAIREFEYSPERGQFRAWLGTITANELRSFFTRSGRFPAIVSELPDPPDPDPAWSSEFTEHILAVALDRIRGEFEPTTWAAFEAVWIHKEAPGNVARRLGTAIHSVYVNKSRVLKRLEAVVLHLADDLPLADPGG